MPAFFVVAGAIVLYSTNEAAGVVCSSDRCPREFIQIYVCILWQLLNSMYLADVRPLFVVYRSFSSGTFMQKKYKM